MARYLEKFQSKMRYTTKQKNLRQSYDYQRFSSVIPPGLEQIQLHPLSYSAKSCMPNFSSYKYIQFYQNKQQTKKSQSKIMYVNYDN